MIGHRGGGGERCHIAQKQLIIKTYPELILYKPVGKYQFTMACIRAVVMIVYQVIDCLISQPKHMLWVLKRTVTKRLCLFVCLFALRPKSTAMVIAGRSVHLTTLFPGQA